MSEPFKHYQGGVPATAEERAEQKRRMKAELARQRAEWEAERERSRGRAEEYNRRWNEIFAAMELDEVIEIPGRQGDMDVTLRMRPAGDGRFETIAVIVKDA